MTAADIQAIRDALAAVPKREQWRAYVHPLQPEELRGYADVVGATRDDDVAENVPIPLARYIAAVHPERIARLLAELDRLRAICVSAHDRLLRGDDDRELLALLATGWEKQ